jgi:hypothetical protein
MNCAENQYVLYTPSLVVQCILSRKVLLVTFSAVMSNWPVSKQYSKKHF